MTSRAREAVEEEEEEVYAGDVSPLEEAAGEGYYDDYDAEAEAEAEEELMLEMGMGVGTGRSVGPPMPKRPVTAYRYATTVSYRGVTAPGRAVYRADPVSRYHQLKKVWNSDGFLKRRGTKG